MNGPVACWTAGPDEIALSFVIRHSVFVEEQGTLVFTDVDAHDRDGTAIVVLAAVGDQIAGTVRLYRVDAVDSNGGDVTGRWRGDRLAVLRPYRSMVVGARLVRYAVATASAAGGTQMEASVQVANTLFFERLGWRRDGNPRAYLGLPHQPMVIDLDDVAPIADSRPVAPTLCRSQASVDASPLLVAV